jgi:hypothetical protein
MESNGSSISARKHSPNPLPEGGFTCSHLRLLPFAFAAAITLVAGLGLGFLLAFL